MSASWLVIRRDAGRAERGGIERPSATATSPTAGAALVGVALFALAACAPHRVWFTDTGARTTRVSNAREPLMRIELARGPGYFLAPTLRAPDQEYGRARQYALIDVAYANPLLARSNRSLDDDAEQPYVAAEAGPPGPLGPSPRAGQWTWQLSVPVAFNLYWDPFTDNQPILNTDYGFGVDVSGRWAPRPGREARVGLYAGHISTHLGDEYVIAARAASARGPFAFDRVNVSYWPVRATGSWRWYGFDAPTGGGGPASIAASPAAGTTRVAGDMRQFVQLAVDVEYECIPLVKCGETGYYQIFPGEASPGRVPLIGPAFEGAVSLDYRRYTAAYGSGTTVPGGTSHRPGSWNVGVTAAMRRVFPYGNGDPSDYAPALNVVAGYAFPITPFVGARYLQPYARLYRGPNPYGQFRNQRDYSFASVGVTLTP